MANVLSFTLGLETSQFLRNLGLASGGILSLAGLAQGLRAVTQGVWGAIERGGQLNDLSNRTGQSVSNLFKLQEAFKVVGLSADSVPSTILRLQRSLSGMSETGERTDKAFSRLGLKLDDLKRLDAPAQFDRLGKALAKLNSSDAAAIAQTLFGREGSGNMLQLARDAQGFRDALAAAAPAAAVFQRTAAAFDKIGDTIALIKTQISGMWAGIAEGIASSLQNVLGWLNSADFVGFGQRIGREFAILGEAIAQSKLDELLALALKAGIQDAANFMTYQFADVSKSFIDAITPSSDFWSKLWNGFKGVITGILAIWDLIGAQLGIPGAQEKADERIDQANQFFERAGISGGLLDKSADAYQKGRENARNEYREQYNAVRAALASDAAARTQSTQTQVAAPTPYEPVTGRYKLSNWEKMGLIFRGGDVQMEQQYGKTTADNTRKTYEAIRDLTKTVKLGGTSFQRR